MTTITHPYSGSPTACAHDASSIDDARLAATPGPQEMSNFFTTGEAANRAEGVTAQAFDDAGASDTSVIHPHPSSLPSPSSTPTNATPKRSRSRKPYERTPMVPHSLPTLRKRKVPRRWEELRLRPRFEAFHDALSSMGAVHAFSLNLTPDREAFYRAKPCAASAILKDIRRNLKNAFGRDVPVAFALEETSFRRLHMHGVIGLGEDEAPRARAALRASVGQQEHVRQHQCHTEANPDEGWTGGYTTKEAPLLNKGGIVDGCGERRITGKHWAASNEVRRIAKSLYEARREEYLG